MTFTAKPENFAPPRRRAPSSSPPTCGRCEAAFGTLGADQLDLFHETTGPPPVEVVEAVLVRDEIPIGNPRDW